LREAKEGTMRRSFVLVAAAAMLVALAPQAVAAPPSLSFNRSSSITAQSFWYSHQQLSKSSYSDSVWYVGVYGSGSFLYSDLYKDVETCKVSHKGTSCTDTFLYGDTDLTSQNFTIDASQLTSANLDAVYQLQAYDQYGNPSGSPAQTHVVADWTGNGSLTRTSENDTYRFGCSMFRFSSRGLFRNAEATGSINGSDLGTTTDAFMATSTETDFERTC
jgi:hypothetical protein